MTIDSSEYMDMGYLGTWDVDHDTPTNTTGSTALFLVDKFYSELYFAIENIFKHWLYIVKDVYS